MDGRVQHGTHLGTRRGPNITHIYPHIWSMKMRGGGGAVVQGIELKDKDGRQGKGRHCCLGDGTDFEEKDEKN